MWCLIWNWSSTLNISSALESQCSILPAAANPIEWDADSTLIFKWIWLDGYALWILMAWCFSTRASVGLVLSIHLCISSYSEVESHLWSYLHYSQVVIRRVLRYMYVCAKKTNQNSEQLLVFLLYSTLVFQEYQVSFSMRFFVMKWRLHVHLDEQLILVYICAQDIGN